MEEGTLFGRYRLIERLGCGGMGEVWRAHDTMTDRVVAIKILLPHFAANPTFAQRFRRDASTAAKLDHPNIASVYDIGEIDGRLYVAMRLIEGGDLEKLLEAGPLDPGRAVSIVGQVGAALQTAHAAGLVHLDVKPSNILLADGDVAYLIDFGVARGAGEVGLTSTGATVGTGAYMAPERFRGGDIEPSADVYALACVLYHCLTGQLPFPGATQEQIAMGHLATPPPQPSQVRTLIPAAMDEVIATGLAKEPAQRYQTTTELVAAARAALNDMSSQPSPLPPSAMDCGPETPLPPTVDWSTALPPLGPAASPLSAGLRQPQVSRTSTTATVARILAGPIIVAVLAVIAIYAFVGHRDSLTTPPTPPATPARPAYTPQAQSGQYVLPFSDLVGPYGVAVDSAGAVYVTDVGTPQVLKLAVGSSTQTALPFADLVGPHGVAVGGDGTVYVTDTIRNRVLKLAPGSSAQSVLPFSGLDTPAAVAVDGDGAVYVADTSNRRVLKLAAGSSTQIVLPFNGVGVYPVGVAVDRAGGVYVTDAGHQVLKLPTGSSLQAALPFTGFDSSFGSRMGVAVDNAGAVYVADDAHNRVLKLDVGSTNQVELPLIGLNGPRAVAVDSAGAVYVADTTNRRVLRLVP